MPVKSKDLQHVLYYNIVFIVNSSIKIQNVNVKGNATRLFAKLVCIIDSTRLIMFAKLVQKQSIGNSLYSSQNDALYAIVFSLRILPQIEFYSQQRCVRTSATTCRVAKGANTLERWLALTRSVRKLS